MTVMKHVALTFPLAVPHYALVMDGLTSYAKKHTDWIFTVCPTMSSGFPETLTMTLDSLRGWPGDGVIAVVHNEHEVEAAAELDIPIVNLSGSLRSPSLPRVMVDNRAIGRMAAQHLLGRGLSNFAYYGVRGVWYGEERREGFRERLLEAGVERCDILDTSPRTDPARPWTDLMQELDDWLVALPRPVGIFAVHDYRARLLIDQCHRRGYQMPKDVAVVGADNDTILCEFSRPSLTSVRRSGRVVGYEAAALLDRLMHGEPPPDADILIPPDGVAQRGSTDMLAIDDPLILEAVQYVLHNISRPFGVELLLERANISRRSFEKRFKHELDCTPHDFICRKRAERAQTLLRNEKRLSIGQVAKESGFKGVRHFRGVFRRLVGHSPREYRELHGESGEKASIDNSQQ
jgi:LacI family transcriptional regulator